MGATKNNHTQKRGINMSKQTAMIDYADATANLFTEFVRYAGSSKKAVEKFCNKFELNMESPKDRKLAQQILEQAQSEISANKEGQKSGDTGSDRDSPRPNRRRKPVDEQVVDAITNSKSVFGAKKGSKKFLIDQLLYKGKYTVESIAEETGASVETVKRRIRDLKSNNYLVETNKNNKVSVKGPWWDTM